MLAWRERLIRRLSAFPRLAALAAALRWARPDEVSWLITELLELAVPPAATPPSRWNRRSVRDAGRLADESIAELVRRWMIIPPDLKPTALAIGRGRWPAAVRSVGQDAAAARGIAALALDTFDPGLIPGLINLLDTPGLQSGLYVERSLVELVRRAAGVEPALVAAAGARAAGPEPDPATFPPDAISRPALEDEIARSVASFHNHRARGVIWCAFMLLEPAAVARGGPLSQWLRDKDQPSLPALRGVIRWSAKPLARLRAWEWLKFDHLATAAADRLTRAQSAREHELVLSRAHLAAHPRRAARLRAIGGKTPGGSGLAATVRSSVLPPAGLVEQLDLESRLGLPRLAPVLHLGSEGTRAALEPLLVDPDPTVRHAAARTLSPRGLSDYVFDEDPRVARSAALSLSAAGVPDVRRKHRAGLDEPGRVFTRLAASPHDAIRLIAEQETERTAWDDPASLPGRIEARRMLAADRHAFLRLLRERWEREPGPRSRLVMLIRRLGLQSEFSEELDAIIRDGLARLQAAPASDDLDPFARAVASAVAAVGEVIPKAPDVLLEAAHRGTGRVRANAVEALGRFARVRSEPGGPGPYDSILEFKQDEHHRVRASVLRAILCGEDTGPTQASALDGLAVMLHDDRPAHRTAGVWLADRTLLHAGRARAGNRWPELASRVVELARTDADASVRRRAEAFALRLRHQLKRRSPAAVKEVA
ncbi:MAG: hypothetical protein IT436_07575 [Phycisphaerales bacterium]|nr:hypothetical protein [Phycisphaerales bacterium]